MTLLASKISELIDTLIVSQEDHVVWRGELGTQTWKIVIHQKTSYPYQFFVNAERRDESTGEPE